jgi:diguanylate cyclase (GGDEF)-like protein
VTGLGLLTEELGRYTTKGSLPAGTAPEAMFPTRSGIGPVTFPQMSQPIDIANGGQAVGQAPVGTVLVASSDTDLLLDIEAAVRAQGFEVILTREGENALRLARKHFPALLILDDALPGPSGVEVSRRLRCDWRFLDRGIVLLAPDPFSAQEAMMTAGADDVVFKPVDPIALADRLGLTFRRLQEMRSSSPLSGLPGNASIERELRRRTSQGMGVGLAYIDIDDFKAYNDYYGFLRGDEMIRALAGVIREAADVRTDVFIGHVGGDDFVLLASPDQVEEIAREILSSFETTVPLLYDPEDAARGCIAVRDRQGRDHHYSLLTLSIGVAAESGPGPGDHRRLVDAATEMKRYAKTQPDNVIAVDRRTGERPAALAENFRAVGRSARSRRRRTTRSRALTAVAAALLLGVVMAGPAFAVVENSSPGEFLWPLKLRIEDARLALEGEAAGDVMLHLEFASRRIGELQQVVAEGDTSLIGTVVGNLDGHNRSAVLVLADTGNSGLPTPILRAQAEVTFRQNVQILEGLVATACGAVDQETGPSRAACPGLRHALGSSSSALITVEGEEGKTPSGDLGENPASEVPPGNEPGSGHGAEDPAQVDEQPPDQDQPGEDPGTGIPPPLEQEVPSEEPPPLEEPPSVGETPPPTDEEEKPAGEGGVGPPGLGGATPGPPDAPPGQGKI